MNRTASEATVVTKASLLAELPPDHECFRRLSQLLDEEDDFCENWRALYAKCELKAGAEAKAATSSLGPTACVLKAWKQRAGPTATVGALVDLLTAIKRLDAVDAVRNALGLNKRSISGLVTLVESPIASRPKRSSLTTTQAAKPFECTLCGESFTYRTGLQSHQAKVHRDVATTSEIATAVVSERDPGARTCSVCGKTFKKALLLEVHMRTHTGERPYACTKCAKTFTRPDHLKAHLGTHSETKVHACTQCNRTFAWPSSLNSHVRSVHNPDVSADEAKSSGGGDNKTFFKCHVTGCGKNFAWPSKLKRHLKSHSVAQKAKGSATAATALTCNLCQKEFSRADALKTHMTRMHSVVQLYRCTACERTFSARGTWEVHIRKSHPDLVNGGGTASKEAMAPPLSHVENADVRADASVDVSMTTATSSNGSAASFRFPATSALSGSNVFALYSIGEPPSIASSANVEAPYCTDSQN